MKQRLTDSRRARAQTINTTTFRWTEKLLQTQVEDHRKFTVWRILAPYLTNIIKCSDYEAYGTIKNWLHKCSQLKRLQFSPNYTIKYNINSAERNGHLPISLEKLETENPYLYNVLTKSSVDNGLQ